MVKIESDQQEAKNCYTSSMKPASKEQDIMEAREQDVKDIMLNPEDPESKIFIGSGILDSIEQDLVSFLERRKSTFAWKHENMTGESLHLKGMPLSKKR